MLRRANPFTAGLVALLLIGIGTFFGFTKDNPFSDGFRLNAVFESANSIRPNSPVRIAGVDVGKVTGVRRQPGTSAAVVEMEIHERGLPVHRDAQLKIRPRIFLEGNFFVELQPGSPSAPAVADGDTVPVTQTATPVQLDEVLTALQSDTREDLKRFLDGYGTALTMEPTASDDAEQDPAARGQSAAASLNDSYRDAGPALRDGAVVNHAFLGLERRDLSRLVAGLARTTEGLGRSEAALQDLVTNFNTTMAALADRQGELRATLRELPPTLRQARTTLARLDGALPATRAFARDILPGVRETPATIDASFPWMRQVRALLRPAELQGLVGDLSPATRDLAVATDANLRLFSQQGLLARCFTDVILPAGDIKIQDGRFTTGVENYKEFWYTMVGLAGEGQNFDGNGQYVRFHSGGGDHAITSGRLPGAMAGADRFFGNASAKPLGTRPAFPGRRPPYRRDVPCHTNALPDLNAAPTGPADGAPEVVNGSARR